MIADWELLREEICSKRERSFEVAVSRPTTAETMPNGSVASTNIYQDDDEMSATVKLTYQ